jgi:Icc-related predicted phosphoesterase
MKCFFASDLHGGVSLYEQLGERMRSERPDAVFLGGDLLAHRMLGQDADEFIASFLARLLHAAGGHSGNVFVILGNDDPRAAEPALLAGERQGHWTYVHDRAVRWRGYDVFGYACVPPTPFLLKDWERYDVSRHVDPGCVSPEEGHRTVPVDERDVRFGTIARDLEVLAGTQDLTRAIFLFHTPPHDTPLDRAALDGRMVDHAPLDVHVGSVAVRRFIERRQPLLTLHGHVHESARLTGVWRARCGRTVILGAAHDGPELALVRFDPERPDEATRELIRVVARN